MNTDIKILISAVDKGVKQTITAVNDGLKRSAGAAKIFSDSLSAGGKAANSLVGSLKGLIGAYAGFAGIREVGQIVHEAEQSMFNLAASVQAASREFENTGSVDYWTAAIAELSDTMKVYTDSALRNAVSRTVDMTKRLGLSADQMKELIKRAGDLGAGKVELTGAIERVTAALRGEAESAEYLGLTLNETYIKAWYEANTATEKAWKDLTDLEKAQIRYRVFLEQTAEMQGRAAESAKTFGGAVGMVRKEIERAITENKNVNQAMQDLAGTLRENSGEIGALIGNIVSLVAKIIEWTVKYKELLGALGGTALAISLVGKLVTVIKALGGAFAYLTGTSFLSWLASLRGALTQAAAATTVLGRAFQAVLIFAAAQAVYNIGLLIKALWDWRAAAKQAQQAQEELASQSAWAEEKAAPALRELSKELGYTVRDLEHFNQLVKEGKIVFDDAAGKWVAAEKKKQDATQKTTEAVKASAQALEDFGKKAKAAYEKALSEAKKYAEQVIEFEKKIQEARMSTEDKIRELSRKGLTEEQQWADKKLQAEEKLAAAKEALRQQDFEKAQKLAEQSQQLYADLAQEVKRETAEGEQVVTQTIDQTKKVAIAGVEAAGQVMEQIFSKQKSIAQSMQTQWETAAGKIRELMDLVNQAQDAKIEISAEGLDAIKAEIEALMAEPKQVNVTANTEAARTELIQLEDGSWTEVTVYADADTSRAKSELSNLQRLGDGMKMEATVTARTQAARQAINEIRQALASIKDKTVTVTVVKKVKTVQEKALGGIVQALAAGGKLFGYGGGDKIRAMLEAGEYVIRKEAVRRYGSWLFDALNAMRIPQDRLAEMFSHKAFAAGGAVTPTEAITLTLNAGNVSAPLTVTGPAQVTRGMIYEIEKELRKMGMTR